MEVLGRVKFVDQTKEVGSAGFKKRDIVITTDEQYPQHILVQFVQVFYSANLKNRYQCSSSSLQYSPAQIIFVQIKIIFTYI